MSYETNRLPLNCNDIPCLLSNHTTAGNSRERDEESLPPEKWIFGIGHGV
jgi:hypothetical protein